MSINIYKATWVLLLKSNQHYIAHDVVTTYKPFNELIRDPLYIERALRGKSITELKEFKDDPKTGLKKVVKIIIKKENLIGTTNN